MSKWIKAIPYRAIYRGVQFDFGYSGNFVLARQYAAAVFDALPLDVIIIDRNAAGLK